ncbi:MAG: hypothetical protein ILO10_04555 [Kiritimatiellae bacterium]|nr:hypothetical protein [Kiritimatiellia bacterium]
MHSAQFIGKMGKIGLLAVLLLSPAVAGASHVTQALKLSAGWNAVYLEVTPDDGDAATTDDASCAKVFADRVAVTTVMAYAGDAYASTRQYADDGSEILQKPVSYQTWVRGDAEGSTLEDMAGGRCYLIYVDGSKLGGQSELSVGVTGIPQAPVATWRDTRQGDFMNLVGVSLWEDRQVAASAYFGEGPYGADGALYQVSGGTGEVPNFKSVAFMGQPKVASGRAYGATAERSEDWGGVIGFVGPARVSFEGTESQAPVQVKNAGTQTRTLRFWVGKSELAGEAYPPGLKRRLAPTDLLADPEWTELAAGTTWEVELAPGESVTEMFSVDRLSMAEGREYGAVLVVDDLSGSWMRVRVPITVAATADEEKAAKFPAGLWSGTILLEAVSRLEDPLPVTAGGTLKMSVMMHVAPDGSAKLLQRVAAGYDTNGTPRLFRELESVPAEEVPNARRFSTVMMSVDEPVVEKKEGAFGDSLAFEWTVAERASDNPFRHAWHPDHDGKTADYSGETPSGDDFGNYANPVKPELWSISNRMVFSWHENNDPSKPVAFERTPGEKTAGFVEWTVGGLTAKEPIHSLGTFVLQRVLAAAEVE